MRLKETGWYEKMDEAVFTKVCRELETPSE
jgi:hypothetical protein